MDWTDKRLKELEERIAEAYKTAEKEITAKMQAYLDRFAKQDAVMLAKYKNGEITKEKLTEWRTNHFMMGKNWQAVKDSIAGDILKTDAISAGIVNNALIDVYTQNANYAYYELEQGTGTGLSFNLYDRNAVENLLKDNPDFMPHYEPKTPIVERWNKQHITSEMLQGILQGESIPKIANRMATVVGMEKNSAIRNARTYTTSVENKAKMDRYEEAEEMGIDLEKEWMATLDERTRESHREMDGVRVANGEPFILINSNGTTCEMMYPADPNGDAEQVYNCRCRIVPRIKGRQYDRSGRATKLGDMSYEEWKKGKEKEEQPKQISEELRQTIKEYTTGNYEDICAYSQYLANGDSDKSPSLWYKSKEEWEEKELPKIDDSIKESVQEITDLINTQEVSSEPLVRIERSQNPAKEGDILDFGIKSTSASEDFVKQTADGNMEGIDFDLLKENNNGEWTEYRFVNSKSLDISSMSEYPDQNERLVCGQYKVVNTEVIKAEKPHWVTESKPISEVAENVEPFVSKSGKDMIRYEYDGKQMTDTVEKFNSRTIDTEKWDKGTWGRKIVYLEYVNE